MNSDCTFYIGTTHKVCQDYAVVRDYPDMSMAILADGCSGSPDSDVGARILVKATEAIERDKIVLSFTGEDYIESAFKASQQLEMPDICLDATLLMAKVQDGQFFIGCHGDGVIVRGFKDGGLYIRSVAFRTSYPDFLSYKINPERKVVFDKINQGAYMNIAYIYPNGNIDIVVKEDIDIPECETGSTDNLSFIAIMSDGIHSFYERILEGASMTNKPISHIDVIKDMFQIKGRKGEFIQRRVNRFRKDCEAKNWHNFDDVSVAVINLE